MFVSDAVSKPTDPQRAAIVDFSHHIGPWASPFISSIASNKFTHHPVLSSSKFITNNIEVMKNNRFPNSIQQSAIYKPKSNLVSSKSNSLDNSRLSWHRKMEEHNSVYSKHLSQLSNQDHDIMDSGAQDLVVAEDGLRDSDMDGLVSQPSDMSNTSNGKHKSYFPASEGELTNKMRRKLLAAKIRNKQMHNLQKCGKSVKKKKVGRPRKYPKPDSVMEVIDSVIHAKKTSKSKKIWTDSVDKTIDFVIRTVSSEYEPLPPMRNQKYPIEGDSPRLKRRGRKRKIQLQR